MANISATSARCFLIWVGLEELGHLTQQSAFKIKCAHVCVCVWVGVCVCVCVSVRVSARVLCMCKGSLGKGVILKG